MNIKLKSKKRLEKTYFIDIPIGTKFMYNGSPLIKVSLDKGNKTSHLGFDESNLTLKKFHSFEIFEIEIDDKCLFLNLKAGVFFSCEDNIFVKQEREDYCSLTGKTTPVLPGSIVTILVPDIDE